MKNKVLYVSSRPPFPAIGGREHMIVQSLKFLAADFEVVVVCFHGRNEKVDVEKIKELGVKKIFTYELPGFFNVFSNLIFRRDKSIQENIYYSPKINELIGSHVQEFQPDVVVADMLRTAQFVLGLKQRVIIDLDDILSKRYQRMIELGTAYSALGTYVARIPKPLQWIEKILRTKVVSFEKSRIFASEKKAVKEADAIILTSPLEADYINEYFATNKATGISQCVNAGQSIDLLESGAGLFIGNMTTAQNIASLQYIADEILPKIDQKNNFKLLVVGKYDHRAEYIANTNGSISLLGFVDDLRSVACQCSVALMPVAFGTGVKTKILDAMGMGLPVITNSVGAEGVAIHNGTHAIISDSSEVLAKEVDDLIFDKKRAADLALNGSEYVATYHSFENLRVRYNNVVKDLISKGGYV